MTDLYGPERTQNPYQNRKVIKNPDDFFGRRKEVHEIFDLISNSNGPQSISVVGERKIGKSSLLLFIKNEIIQKKYLESPDDYIFIYLELNAFLNYDSKEFCKTLLKELSSAVSEDIPSSGETSCRLLERFVSLLSSRGKRIIFMFDEFDSISQMSAFDFDLLEYFRALAGKYPLSFIICSRISIQELTKIGKGSPFFNIFHNFYLGYLREEEALELIQIPSSKQKVIFNMEDIKFVNEVAFLHPFFIQIACCHLFNLRKEENKLNGEKLNSKSYDLLFQRFCNDTISHWKFYFDHMDEQEKDLISKIFAGKSISHVENKIAYRLYNRSLVYMRDGKWKVLSPAFQECVLGEKKINKLEKRELRKESSIKRYLISYFINFLASLTVVIFTKTYFIQNMSRNIMIAVVIAMGTILTGFFWFWKDMKKKYQ